MSSTAAKSCYSIEDLRAWDSVGATLEPPARLAVIGDPVAHSLSPQMHNPGLAARGLNAQYIRMQVPAGSVAEALQLFRQHGFIGINCTIPHKFEALAAVDVIDPHAAKLGAVNTVLIQDGTLTGFNSDGPGFENAVQEVFGKSLRELRVLIIGAGGGAGWAVAKHCASVGCRSLSLLNRTEEKVQELKTEVKRDFDFDVKAGAWPGPLLETFVADSDLIVNATSLGLKPDDSEVLPAALITAHHLVFDMVYRRGGTTPLIMAARTAGAKSCDGLPLLLHQGAVSFAHWFGGPAPLEAMREGLRAAGAS